MKKVLILILLLQFKNVRAQEVKVVRDFGIWAGVAVEKKLGNDFNLALEQQLRTFKNTTQIDDYLLDVGVKYTMNKYFKLGVNVRYVHNVKRYKATENNFRYNLDLAFRLKIVQKIQLQYRARYQQEFVNLFTKIETQRIRFSGIRNKVKMSFKYVKKHSFYTSAELFYLIETFRQPYFNKLRFYLGDDIKTKIGYFDCSFGFEQEIQSNYPTSFFFVKTIYKLKL